MTSILKTDEIQSQNGGAVVKMQTLKHPSASGNNLELGSDGSTTITNGTLSAGTIGTSVTFPTRSDLGIIEIFEAGDPLIPYNANQDFSYTSGQPYFVMCNVNGAGNTSLWEYYNITTSNTVSELKSWTATITPSIPSNGTLRISVSDVNSDRDVWAVLLVRMNH